MSSKFTEKYFQITERGSSIRLELLAGLSTFLSLSYIFVVNPAILAEAGMNPEAVLFATVLVSAMATLAMGIWARLPFVLAPGLEMNAYVAFFVVGTLGFTWQEALGAVFWSGVLFIVISVTGLRERILHSIPDSMKTSLAFAVGVFIALIGLRISGVLVYDGVQLVGVGDFFSKEVTVLVFGLAIVGILSLIGFRAAVLVGIVSAAILCGFLGLTGEKPESYGWDLGSSLSAVGQADLGVIADPRMLSAIIVLFVIDFYGSVAKLIGLSLNTSLLADGKLPRLREALLVDGAATTVGAGFGTTSLTTFVESGVGIAAGGRTGLTAIVCAALMLFALLLHPYLHLVPVVATSGALLFIGYQLAPDWQKLRSGKLIDHVVVLSMGVTVVLTFALDRALLVGILFYTVGIVIKERRAPDPYLIASGALIGLMVILQ